MAFVYSSLAALAAFVAETAPQHVWSDGPLPPGSSYVIGEGKVYFLFFFLLCMVCLYALPVRVAQRRNAKRKIAIAMLNLLLGWTLIGWLVALVWACNAEAGSINQRACALS